MKKHRLFFIILVVVALGLASWGFRPLKDVSKNKLILKKTSSQASVASSLAQALVARYTPEQTRARNSINAMLYRNPTGPIPVTLLAAAGVDKSQIIGGIQNAENQNPVEAFGKVIDQHGAPVVGAKVDGNVLLNAGLTTSKYETHSTVTDANGSFQFTGLHGVNLGISIKKEGYETNNKGFTGAQGKLSQVNRDTYLMWKLKGAEPMVHSKIHDYVPCDGTEIHYDLLTGKRVKEGGDLVVKLTRYPVDIVRGKRFDWQISLELADGGLAGIHDPYPYQAPEGSYVPSITIAHKIEDKDWSVDFDANYYVKARGGQIYARIKVSANANYQPPPTAFDVDIYANPAGSRNLEFDPAKEIKAK